MAQAASQHPNLVLITTDQQRHDTVGTRSPEFLRTPHLDHLAREGATFSRAYADNPLCVPARVSLMTGKTVFEHGMAANAETSSVIDRWQSLPALLRNLGYQTAAIGKMHFSPQRARHGFDEMILPADYYRAIQRSGSTLQPMRHGLGQNELFPGLATVPESQTLTSWIAEQATEYIWERRDPTIPFFLWLSFSKPHPPLDPPEPYYSMYLDSPIPAPVYGDWATDEFAPEAFKRIRQRWSYDLIPSEILHAARAAYYGLITQIDYNIGRVLAALHDLPMSTARRLSSSRVEDSLLDNTLIIFTSDHGEYLGDHGTGGKYMFHEPSAHVPFIIRFPRNFELAPGITNDSIVTHADVLPTLISAAGGEPSVNCEGKDLLSVLKGDVDTRTNLIGTTSGFEPGEPLQYIAMIDGSWKYIWYPEGSQEQLFALESDPDELTDLARDRSSGSRREDLQALLVSQLKRIAPHILEKGELPVRPIGEDPEHVRRAHGYPAFHHEEFDVDVRH